MKIIFLLTLLTLISCFRGASYDNIKTDLLIIGGGASGTMAGIQAARAGVQVMIAEETPWLGGMLTSAGVSAIDGNHNLPSGLWNEFRQNLYTHYGGPDAVNTGWVSNVLFEPSVGDSILKNMTREHANLHVRHGLTFVSIEKTNDGWLAHFDAGSGIVQVRARVVVDATELGDVATGIIKGEGKNVGWANHTWFHPDSVMTAEALLEGLKELVSEFSYPFKGDIVTAIEALEAAFELSSLLGTADPKQDIHKTGTDLWNSYNFGTFKVNSPATRAQVAVVIDQVANPFGKVAVDLKGDFGDR